MEDDNPGPRHKTANHHRTISSWYNKNHFPLGHTVRTAAPGLILALASSLKHYFPFSRYLKNE